MSEPELITLGCRLNIAESEAMAAMARGEDGLVIVNSCAVTAEALRHTRQAIRAARRRRPDARILVTGCAAETDRVALAAMPEVDRIVGNGEKLERGWLARNAPAPPAGTERTRRRTRGFLIVQNGCDHRCTFCIIPQGRGASRSVPVAELIAAARLMVEEGVAEIVLTGVDLTSYGADLDGTSTLGGLVEALLTALPALPRLRLSSLDGAEIDDQLFDLLTGEARVMPHVHLSLQSGDDLILKRMKRRHARADAVRLVDQLHARRPDIAIGADIIAGFPTETAAAFANSLAMVRDCRIVHGHVFPYSPRPGTPAARMPQVAAPVIRERARRLREACATARADWLAAHVGTIQSVLIERSGLDGHAPDFAPVRLDDPAAPGAIVDARIRALEDGRLIAQIGDYG